MIGVTLSLTNLPTTQPHAMQSDKVKNSLKQNLLKQKKMPQSLCSLPMRTKPQTTLLKSEEFAFSSTPATKSMHKSTTLDPKEIAGFPAVEIGTRGTVVSLIMQEIEYFSRIELNSQDRPHRNKSKITDVGSSISTTSRCTIASTAENTKKKRGSGKLLPSMCSMVDVSDQGRPNGTSSFSYRNLRSDTKKFHV